MTLRKGRTRRTPARNERDEIPAATFKATCLDLMDRVLESRAEYVVTKHGRPVAKLVPYTEPEPKRFWGSMEGTVLKYESPLDPLDDDWDINRD